MKEIIQTTTIISSLLSLFLFTTTAFSQTIDLSKINQQFYTAYAINSLSAWEISLKQLENNTDEAAQLTLAKGYYGAAGTSMAQQDKNKTNKLLDKAETIVKNILKKNKKSAEANSLLSAIYGLQIALSPMKGMLLGGKSSDAAKRGVELAPESAFTNLIMGNYLFHTPSMFGGDVVKSLTFLKKSKEIYEAEDTTKNWEYINLMSLLGQAYYDQKQYEKAVKVYKSALELAPNFGYIKMVLLPKTEKAIKE